MNPGSRAAIFSRMGSKSVGLRNWMSMRSSRPIFSNTFCAAAISIRAKLPLRALARPSFSSTALTLRNFSFPLIRKRMVSPGTKRVPGTNFSGRMIPDGSNMSGNKPFRSSSTVLMVKSRMPLSCNRSVPIISTTSPLVDSTPYPSTTG